MPIEPYYSEDLPNAACSSYCIIQNNLVDPRTSKTKPKFLEMSTKCQILPMGNDTMCWENIYKAPMWTLTTLFCINHQGEKIQNLYLLKYYGCVWNSTDNFTKKLESHVKLAFHPCDNKLDN